MKTIKLKLRNYIYDLLKQKAEKWDESIEDYTINIIEKGLD